MGDPSADDLDGISRVGKYADDTVVRVFVMRTERDVYSSGWAYNLHYGATEPNPPATLEDGTIRRYDNAHEHPDAGWHHRHVGGDEPEAVEFEGLEAHLRRFRQEVTSDDD